MSSRAVDERSLQRSLVDTDRDGSHSAMTVPWASLDPSSAKALDAGMLRAQWLALTLLFASSLAFAEGEHTETILEASPLVRAGDEKSVDYSGGGGVATKTG